MKVSKVVKFEAAHRLLNYKGDCNNLHGHSYKVKVTLEGEVVLSSQMVMDFSEIKEGINSTLRRFDHAVILNSQDPLIKVLKDLKVVITNGDPTAEIMAEYFSLMFSAEFSMDTTVEVWETENNSAIAFEEAN